MYRNIAAAVLLVVTFVSSSSNGQSPANAKPADRDSGAAEKVITETLRTMYEAEKRKDLDFIFANLSEDFAEVAGDGKLYYKSDIAAGFKDMVLKNYTISDCHFKLLTADSAYHTCEMRADAEFKGKPIPNHFRVTWLWTREQGKWLLRFEQGTMIPEPAKTGTAN